MEELIQRVIEKLMIRRKNSLILSFDRPISTVDYGEKDFICNHIIRLEGVSYSFLDGLKDSANPWVDWLLTASRFGCRIQIQANFDSLHWLPEELFLKWPLEIYHPDGRQCHCCAGQIITYEKVMSVPSGSNLVIRSDQRMTAIAEEALQKRDVLLLGREK